MRRSPWRETDRVWLFGACGLSFAFIVVSYFVPSAAKLLSVIMLVTTFVLLLIAVKRSFGSQRRWVWWNIWLTSLVTFVAVVGLAVNVMYEERAFEYKGKKYREGAAALSKGDLARAVEAFNAADGFEDARKQQREAFLLKTAETIDGFRQEVADLELAGVLVDPCGAIERIDAILLRYRKALLPGLRSATLGSCLEKLRSEAVKAVAAHVPSGLENVREAYGKGDIVTADKAMGALSDCARGSKSAAVIRAKLDSALQELQYRRTVNYAESERQAGSFANAAITIESLSAEFRGRSEARDLAKRIASDWSTKKARDLREAKRRAATERLLSVSSAAANERNTIGEWIDGKGTMWQHTIRIVEEGNAYFAENNFIDGSKSRHSLARVKARKGERYRFKSIESGFGEEYAVLNTGNLSLFDQDGFIRMPHKP